MVALVRKDRIEAAWIHDPLGGETAVAQAGAGAWIADRRLLVAPPERPVKSLRSAAHEYLRLARGEIHYALFTKLMPWDHAAGVLVHAEAGGQSAYLDGAPYRPSAITAQPLLLAPDAQTWRRLETALLSD
jgi:fructose-1,6-bisphosphatase/inositol monophosphatase family enzyme